MRIKIVNKTEFELPKYSTIGSAGMDLRANLKPEKIKDIEEDIDPYDEEDWNEADTIILEPRKQQLVPTGIYIALPKPVIEAHSGQGWGYEAQIRPRSGLAAKHGITVVNAPDTIVVNAPGTIDCFSEKSTIKTIEGEKNIMELKINDVILSTNNDTLEIEKDTIDAIVNTGIQDILIIETEDGILEITPNTLVYTEDGVKMAHELNLNDNIIFLE